MRYLSVFRLLAMSAATISVCAGCCKDAFDQVNHAADQEELGQTQFAIVSVSHWDDVEQSLQPNFSLTAEEALDLVAPNTQSRISRRIAGSSVKVGLGFPTKTVNDEVTTTTETGKDPVVKRIETITNKSGEAPDVSGMDSPDQAVEADRTNGVGAAIEPTLAYSLATSLHQYVQLTNRYIQDRVKKENYTAFVVRMQVGLMPEKRNMPYDTYVDIAFFPAQQGSKIITPTTGPADAADRSEDSPAQAYHVPVPDPAQKTSDYLRDAVIVVPLLSADSLEGLLQDRSNDELREAALSLAATVKGIGGSVDVSSFLREVVGVLGRDFNSVMSLGTRNDSVVRVRLGALQQASSQYGMVPRQQTVSIALLVRDDLIDQLRTQNARVARVTAVAQSKHVNAIDATVPPARQPVTRIAELRAIAGENEQTKLLNDTQLECAADAAIENDLATFEAVLREAGAIAKDELLDLRKFGSVWIQFANVKPAKRPTFVTFNLPPTPSKPPELPLTGQRAVLRDDGTKTICSLYNGRALDKAELAVQLIIESKNESGQTVQEKVAGAVVIENRGRDLSVTFPSVRAIHPKVVKKVVVLGKFARKNPQTREEELVPLEQDYGVWIATVDAESQTKKVEAAAAEKRPARLLVASSTDLKDGKASVTLNCQQATDGKVYTIQAISPLTISAVDSDKVLEKITDSPAWLVKATGDVKVTLEGFGSNRVAVLNVLDGNTVVHKTEIHIPIPENAGEN